MFHGYSGSLNLPDDFVRNTQLRVEALRTR
jgi:hypothetical protein